MQFDYLVALVTEINSLVVFPTEQGRKLKEKRSGCTVIIIVITFGSRAIFLCLVTRKIFENLSLPIFCLCLFLLSFLQHLLVYVSNIAL